MSSVGAMRWSDKPSGKGRRIGIVAATWHDDVVQKLIEGCHSTLIELGVHEKDIVIVRCPGTFEIPLTASIMAISTDYHAVITLGVVIRGETAHFEFIAGSAVQALQTIAVDTGVPVVFGVLTVDTKEQALERTGGVHGHKGAEAAETALRMAAIVDALTATSD